MDKLLHFAAVCQANQGKVCLNSLPDSAANSGAIQTVIQIVIAVMGAVAFLIIVLAGVRYIMSRGDPQQVAQAKNTIIYAIIGLVVVIFAQVIVSFVVKKV